MRLLYFTPLLSTRGGIERTLIDKANYLAEKGHEVMFVTYEHEGPVAYALYTTVKHVDLSCHFFEIYRYSFYRRFFEAFRQKKAFRKKMSEILRSYNPEVIVVSIPNTEIFINDLVAVVGHIPLVIESHLAYGYQVMHRGFMEKLMIFLYSPMKSIRKADLLIALTEGDAACWRRHSVPHVEVIHNPVTFYDSNLKFSEKSVGRIISVGRLTSQKRYDRLIDAFALIAEKHPGWYLDIYGEGHEKSRIKKQISDKGLLDRIHILPPTSDIYAEYKRSQFLVLSSDYEGFGLVIVEAMACGIPVLSTDCPYGPSEIIENGVTGVLSKMEVKDLSNQMEFLISHEEERQAMGKRARQAVSRYRKESVMPLWEKSYLQISQLKKVL